MVFPAKLLQYGPFPVIFIQIPDRFQHCRAPRLSLPVILFAVTDDFAYGQNQDLGQPAPEYLCVSHFFLLVFLLNSQDQRQNTPLLIMEHPIRGGLPEAPFIVTDQGHPQHFFKGPAVRQCIVNHLGQKQAVNQSKVPAFPVAVPAAVIDDKIVSGLHLPGSHLSVRITDRMQRAASCNIGQFKKIVVMHLHVLLAERHDHDLVLPLRCQSFQFNCIPFSHKRLNSPPFLV